MMGALNTLTDTAKSQKVPILLLLLIGLVFACTTWEKSYVKDMRRSFASMYNDRLVPASDLFHISDHLFSKRLLLSNYLLAPDAFDVSMVRHDLEQHDTAIASLVADIDQTFLVRAESKSLTDFKNKVARYNNMEKALVAGSQTQDINAGAMLHLFDGMRHDLLLLTDIQTLVGQQLNQSTVSSAASFNSLAELEIFLIFAIGLAVQVLLLTGQRPTLPPGYRNMKLN